MAGLMFSQIYNIYLLKGMSWRDLKSFIPNFLKTGTLTWTMCWLSACRVRIILTIILQLRFPGISGNTTTPKSLDNLPIWVELTCPTSSVTLQAPLAHQTIAK